MKWIISTLFLLLFFSGIGQISKTLLEHKQWYIFPSAFIKDSISFKDSLIISRWRPPIYNHIIYTSFEFADSENVNLYSEHIDTTTFEDTLPPYNILDTVIGRRFKIEGKWKVQENKLLTITLKLDNGTYQAFVFDAVMHEEGIILRRKKNAN